MPDFALSEFSVSALENPTVIDVTTKGLRERQFRIFLDPFETYQFQASLEADDLTGSSITSDNPVAVVSACQCASVTIDHGGCDYLVEQMPPVESLGVEYILATFPGRINGYVYRVIGTSPQATHVELSNDDLQIKLQPGDFYEVNVVAENEVIKVTSDQPVLVVQYMKGFNGPENDITGDPSMVIVPPVQMFGKDVAFALFEVTSDDTWEYYISATINCDALQELAMDDQYMSDWDKISSSDGKICVSRGPVNPDSVHIVWHSNPTANFFVMVTAQRKSVSYAYPAGYNLEGMSIIKSTSTVLRNYLILFTFLSHFLKVYVVHNHD